MPEELIRYGDRIRLQHEATNRFIASFNRAYIHDGSSGQQMVVAKQVANDDTLWIVRGPNEQPIEYGVGTPVPDGAIIRLTHSATGRNLHSHGDRESPLTRQQEVTAYGTHGIGDGNDNWILRIGGGGQWTVGKTVNLIHQGTRKALHSHDFRDAKLTAEEQEVTCYPPGDHNDDWQVPTNEAISAATAVNKAPSGRILNALSLAGSIASITGWSLLTLKAQLDGFRFDLAVVLGFAISALLFVGLASFVTSWFITRYRRYASQPRPAASTVGIYATGGSLILALGVVFVWLIPFVGLKIFKPLIEMMTRSLTP